MYNVDGYSVMFFYNEDIFWKEGIRNTVTVSISLSPEFHIHSF